MTFYLEAEDADALEAHARSQGVTASEAMRRALRAYLHRHERN